MNRPRANPVRVFAGRRAVAAVDPADRGLGYGDGLFETMRAHRGAVPWWDRHWARLSAGAERIGLPLPDRALVEAEAASLLAGEDAVLKLIVTRGAGGRGYAPERAAQPTWVLSRHPLPAPAQDTGIALRWCQTRFAVQPALAGMKHCNRLEQVLARREWDEPDAEDRDADEGLMLDTDGHVVSATSGNVFVWDGNRWSTPAVDRCGVAGVCRGWVLDAVDAHEVRLAPADVVAAQAVFVCNAVRGILPVARLGAHRWPHPHPAVGALRQTLAAAHPAFVP